MRKRKLVGCLSLIGVLFFCAIVIGLTSDMLEPAPAPYPTPMPASPKSTAISPTPTPIPPEPTATLRDTPRPTNTPKPTLTRAPTIGDIRSDLEWALGLYDQVTFLGVRIVGRELFIEVAIDRTSGEAFFEALGAIHGAVAEIHPDVDRVTIEDVTGQRITVEMSKLIAHYKDQITFREFRDTWEIVNP